jgi:hypothetical protein
MSPTELYSTSLVVVSRAVKAHSTENARRANSAGEDCLGQDAYRCRVYGSLNEHAGHRVRVVLRAVALL